MGRERRNDVLQARELTAPLRPGEHGHVDSAGGGVRGAGRLRESDRHARRGDRRFPAGPAGPTPTRLGTVPEGESIAARPFSGWCPAGKTGLAGVSCAGRELPIAISGKPERVEPGIDPANRPPLAVYQLTAPMGAIFQFMWVEDIGGLASSDPKRRSIWLATWLCRSGGELVAARKSARFKVIRAASSSSQSKKMERGSFARLGPSSWGNARMLRLSSLRSCAVDENDVTKFLMSMELTDPAESGIDAPLDDGYGAGEAAEEE